MSALIGPPQDPRALDVRAIAAQKTADLRAVVRRYAERIEVRVAERHGGRFDIALEVDGLEVGYVNLLADQPLGVHWGAENELMAGGPGGDLVPLP